MWKMGTIWFCFLCTTNMCLGKPSAAQIATVRCQLCSRINHYQDFSSKVKRAVPSYAWLDQRTKTKQFNMQQQFILTKQAGFDGNFHNISNTRLWWTECIFKSTKHWLLCKWKWSTSQLTTPCLQLPYVCITHKETTTNRPIWIILKQQQTRLIIPKLSWQCSRRTSSPSCTDTSSDT